MKCWKKHISAFNIQRLFENYNSSRNIIRSRNIVLIFYRSFLPFMYFFSIIRLYFFPYANNSYFSMHTSCNLFKITTAIHLKKRYFEIPNFLKTTFGAVLDLFLIYGYWPCNNWVKFYQDKDNLQVGRNKREASVKRLLICLFKVQPKPDMQIAFPKGG